MSEYQRLVSEIIQLSDKNKPVIIAIDGAGGAGKTTLADKISESIGHTYVVHLDDFILKENMSDSSWERGFDRKRLEDQVLMLASIGLPIRFQKLLWGTNSLSDPISVPPVVYIIIEGITAFHPAIVRYYHYRIWVDTPIEVAKMRGIARDSGSENEKLWDLWAENDLLYQNKYHPEKGADIIIKGT